MQGDDVAKKVCKVAGNIFSYQADPGTIKGVFVAD
jgi:nucleoside diphosphate kinase